MATTSLIANGTTELASADFSLATGESATLSLSGVPDIYSRATIQFKASDSSYVSFGELTTKAPVQVLTAVGTFRCVRRVGVASFGVDQS